MTLETPDHTTYDRDRAKRELQSALDEADGMFADRRFFRNVCVKCGLNTNDCCHDVGQRAYRTFMGERP